MNFSNKNHEHKIINVKNVSKKIILGIVFVFATSFSFASINSFSTHLTKIHCVTVHTSCGIIGNACGSSVQGLIDSAIALDDWVCG
jgi:hypothetical protein